MVLATGRDIVRSGHVEHVRLERLSPGVVQSVDNYLQMDNAMGRRTVL